MVASVLNKYKAQLCAFFIIVSLFFPDKPALAGVGRPDFPPVGLLPGVDRIVLPASGCGSLDPVDGFPLTAAYNADGSQPGMGYNWSGPPPQNPDWRSIKFDTAYFMIYQLAAIGVLYVAPDHISGWNKHDKDDFKFKKWADNASNPVFDKDDWWINYIMHPYWGATYYTLGRERGLKRSQSFWFSFFLSTLFEYGAEALFEPVSIQDMIVTPVAGSLLGEYLFSPIRERIRSHDELSWPDKTILFLTDPIGVINSGVSRFLGLNAKVRFSQLRLQNVAPSPWAQGNPGVSKPDDSRITPVWGLQLKLTW